MVAVGTLVDRIVMQLEFNGVKALIFGADEELGAACAEQLAAEGLDLAVCGSDIKRLKDVTKLLRAMDAAVTSHNFDIGRLEHQDSVVEVVKTIDFAVLCMTELDEIAFGRNFGRDWEAAFTKTFAQVVAMLSLVCEELAAGGGGVVVVTLVPSQGRMISTLRNALNAAIAAVISSVGKELATAGVRVVGVDPGLLATARFESKLREDALRSHGDPNQWSELFDEYSAVNSAESIAELVTFALSSAGAGFGGCVLPSAEVV